jgi:hypothetical protein
LEQNLVPSISMLSNNNHDFFCVGVMYSGEYDACNVTLSVYPHRATLKNMPGHGGNRTYDLWNTSPHLSTLHQHRKKFMITRLHRYWRNYRLSSEISHTRTDLTA